MADEIKSTSSISSSITSAINEAVNNSSDAPPVIDPAQPLENAQNPPLPKGNPIIPVDIFEWMQGRRTVPPAHLAKMMSDISNKMGYYIAYVIIQRITNMGDMLDQLSEVERQLFTNKSFAGMTDSQLMSYHSRLKNTVNDFLEFARKFSVEAKDIIIDPERDELVNLVRSLDADGLKAVKELLSAVKKDRTGSGTAQREGVSIEDFEEKQGRM